jgi:hypothetical protein
MSFATKGRDVWNKQGLQLCKPSAAGLPEIWQELCEDIRVDWCRVIGITYRVYCKGVFQNFFVVRNRLEHDDTFVNPPIHAEQWMMVSQQRFEPLAHLDPIYQCQGFGMIRAREDSKAEKTAKSRHDARNDRNRSAGAIPSRTIARRQTGSLLAQHRHREKVTTCLR